MTGFRHSATRSCSVMPRTLTDPTLPAQGGAEPFDRRIGFALRRAYQRASANVAQSLHGSGLSVPRFSVLLCLKEKGPLSQNLLGRLVSMEPGNIHGIVRALTSAGLVTTWDDAKDGRRRLVGLTAAGADRLAEVRQASDRANAATLALLSPTERTTLFALLERITATG